MFSRKVTPKDLKPGTKWTSKWEDTMVIEGYNAEAGLYSVQFIKSRGWGRKGQAKPKLWSFDQIFGRMKGAQRSGASNARRFRVLATDTSHIVNQYGYGNESDEENALVSSVLPISQDNTGSQNTQDTIMQ
uniref:Uncharacterized protein n=1 Tax=Chromera velia CCMP2878 TaxID=1169474 RepID=A0A0G4H6V9_9ALVE|eukprot:Cvel_24877.t1-p1 / transcript=Cvel_24877.t1 / gene=Cvel_24877 / organism=Chromera_velia_CCMP2878 / gene_product=hypothetical protein / transcript_product=hypothetical protein / location=Cvel_scaffold2749:11506-11895(-) / protein_length=130 / sequence_SO=supercontig / SO=protein_coding / is_pseudo=false